MKYELLFSDANTQRIDKYISEKLPELSRSFIQQLIKNEEVLINGKPCKSNYKCNRNAIATRSNRFRFYMPK